MPGNVFKITDPNVRNYIFKFTNVTGANALPDVDTEIDLVGAKKISRQVDAATDLNHTATNWDLNIITSATSGGTFDTTVYQDWNFGDDAIDTKPLTPGPNFAKVRLDENGALRADVTVIVTVEK